MFVAARRTNDYGAERRIVECPKCHCTISYDEDDVDCFVDGKGLFCPDCNEQIYLEKYGKYQFPEAFYHFSNPNTKHLSDQETQEFVDKVVSFLQKAVVASSCETGTGDTMVIGKKYKDGDSIIVCKDYYSLMLPND